MRSQPFRAFIEVAPDCFMPRDKLALDADALAGATKMLKASLRETIGGMVPLMGEDTVLQICREVVAEGRARPKRRRP